MEPSEILARINDWLEGEVSTHDGTCYEEQEESFEMGVLAGRLECASGLQAEIQQLEKKAFFERLTALSEGQDLKGE